MLTDNSNNLIDSSKVQGKPTGSDTKTLPLNVLKQKVIDKIYSYKQLSDDYKEMVVNLFKPLKFDRQTYLNMLSDKNFLQDDTRLFNVPKNKQVKDLGETSPRAMDEVAKGFDPDNTKPFYFSRVFKVLPGAYEGTVPGLFSTNGQCHDNPHWCTSLLKWYLSCLIQHFDLTANSLSGKKWLNHTGKGPNVITGAFDTHCLMSKMEIIQRNGLPVLMVLERHHEGFHFGTQRSYFCDTKGRVKGVSHGSDHFWYDVNDTFGSAGSVGTYKYTTVANFGNQRILWFRPGVSYAEEPYTPRREKVWTPLKDENSIYYNPDPPSPSYDLGLYDMVEENPPQEVILRPKKRLIDNIEPVPRFVSFVRCVTSPTNWLKGLAYTAVYGSVLYAGSVTNHKRAAICACTGIASAHHVIKYYRRLTTTPTIKLAIIPLRFTGKYAKALTKFYTNNPIDGDTHLPYGFYYLNKEGTMLIQVNQVGDGANYTNAYKLIQRFCSAHGMSHNNAPGIYEESIPHSGPNITKPNDAVFHDPLESPIKRITASCEYKVEVKETKQVGVRLLSQEKYRQFVASRITKSVVAASASNRVCCGGKVSKLTREQHHELFRKFWFKYTKESHPILPLLPDLSSYSGSKYRKYLAAFLTLGAKHPFVKYTTFMKMEALNLDSFVRKAVRLISPNTPLFNVAHKNFFHWFEKTLLSFTSQYGHHIFAKGHSVHKRWLTILDLSKKFKICVPIDFKNFDATHRNQAFAAECDMYADLGLPQEAADDLSVAKTKGVVQHSIPMRHSGDLFTGSGNCLAVGTALSSAGLEHFTFFCDGDDTLLFMDDESQLEILVKHLDDLGYTITYDPAIYFQNEWEIEFCHVMYNSRGYYVDSERMLNRFCNIIGSSDDALAKTILGKLQALSILEATGIDFGVPVSKFIRVDDCNERDRIVMSMYQGMEAYQSDKVVKVDLLGIEGGLAGRIIADFVKYDIVLSRVGIRHWRRLALMIIKSHLKMEHEDQDFDKDSIRRLHQADAVISELHLQAIIPYIDDMYRELFARMYNLQPHDFDTFWSHESSRDIVNQKMHRFSVRVNNFRDLSVPHRH